MASSNKMAQNLDIRHHFSANLCKPVTQSQLLDVLVTVHGGWGESVLPQETQMIPEAEQWQRPLQVLLVEDNELNLQSASKLLQKLNCEVTPCRDGLLAVHKADEMDFDLIIMDIRMPYMDGLEATRRIRRRGGTNARVPIIAMTAESMVVDRERCLRVGMDDYVNKPIRLNDLTMILDRWR